MKYLKVFNDSYYPTNKIEESLYTVDLWRFLEENSPDAVNVNIEESRYLHANDDDIKKILFNIRYIEVSLLVSSDTGGVDRWIRDENGNLSKIEKSHRRIKISLCESVQKYISMYIIVNIRNYVTSTTDFFICLNGKDEYYFFNNNDMLEIKKIISNFINDNKCGSRYDPTSRYK